MASDTEVKDIETQESISQWGTETFGVKTIAHLNIHVSKLVEEFNELIYELDMRDIEKARSEMADVLIVLAQIATLCNVNLQEEVNKKMQVNRNRKWKLSANGTFSHVKESHV